MRVVIGDVVIGDWGLGMRVVIGDWWSVISEAPTTNHQPPSEAPTTNHQPPITNHQSPTTPSRRRRSFTLVELLITVSIIAIMASMILFALYAAQEQARVQKTRALIAKLNNIIRDRYDSYRTRRLPMPDLVDELFSDGNGNGVCDSSELASLNDTNGNGVWDYTATTRAKLRLNMLRDIMRMEMPDRWSDVVDNPTVIVPGVLAIDRPALSQAYVTKYSSGPPSPALQNSECLYMIVMEAVAQLGDAREVFKPTDVGDVDNDGFPEFIDAWGTPIRFLRWAPGFISEVQTLARAKPTQNATAGQIVTVEFPPAGFSTSPGDYIGGTLAVLDEMDGERINPTRMARITGYSNDGTTRAVFTCETQAPQPEPFNGNVPMTSETVVVMGPDPFDPRGVYPDYLSLDTSVPTYALYPLIYSCGPDKAPGIAADFDPTTPLSYTAHQLSPFVIAPSPPPAWPFPLMIGSYIEPGSTLPGFYVGCWSDNIHNHQLNMR